MQPAMNDTLPLTPKPHLTIRPSSGWSALNLREIWQYRDLLTTLAGRDIKLRYRQTVLGVVWVVLQPLIAAGIFSFVFGRVAKMPSDGVPYFLFAYAGLLGWNVFSSTLSKVSGCLTGNAPLISKVFFPRLVLPLSTLYGTLLDFGVAFGMLAVLMMIHGVPIQAGFLLLPLWLLSLLMLALGMGMFFASLMVSYRDVQHILPVVIQCLLYASPVAYAVTAVPPALRAFYYLNPLSAVLEAFRWSLLGTGELHPGPVAYSTLFAVAVFTAGAFAFKRMERRFADVI